MSTQDDPWSTHLVSLSAFCLSFLIFLGTDHTVLRDGYTHLLQLYSCEHDPNIRMPGVLLYMRYKSIYFKILGTRLCS